MIIIRGSERENGKQRRKKELKEEEERKKKVKDKGITRDEETKIDK